MLPRKRMDTCASTLLSTSCIMATPHGLSTHQASGQWQGLCSTVKAEKYLAKHAQADGPALAVEDRRARTMRSELAPSERSTLWPFCGQYILVFKPWRSRWQLVLSASTACTRTCST